MQREEEERNNGGIENSAWLHKVDLIKQKEDQTNRKIKKSGNQRIS